MATAGIRPGDYVPNTTVRLPGAKVPATSHTSTSHRSTITTLSTKTTSAVGGALGGAAALSSNDLQSVLQNLVQLLQQLVQVVQNMVAGASGGGPAQSGCDMGGKGSVPTPPATTQAPAQSFAAPPAPPTQATTAVAGADGDNSSFEAQVVQLVNQQRAQYGLGPLRYNVALDRAAESHNAEQVQARTMAHIDIGDGDPGSRIRSFGFNGAWGENVAVGQKSPQQVVAEWMASPTHRANILNPNYHQLGVAYNVTSDGYPFWTQEFGA